MGLTGEIQKLSETFPHGLSLNDRISTVSDSELYVQSELSPIDGSIYVLSNIKHSDSGSNYVYYGYISKILESGNLDTTFGNSGITKVHSSFGDKEHYNGFYLKNNELILTGHNWRIPNQSFYSVSVKVSSSGVVDANYGYLQHMITNRTYCTSIVKNSANDNFYLCYTGTDNIAPLYIIKSNGNGGFDTSFGNSGVIDTGISAYYGAYAKIYIDSSDNLYIAYLNPVASVYHSAVARFTPEGVLDTNFGENGYIHAPSGDYSYFSQILFENGKLYGLVSYKPSTAPSTGLLHIFGAETGAEASPSVDLGSEVGAEFYPNQILYYKNKLIVLAYLNSTGKYAIQVYNPDMSLDKNFGVDGVLDISLENGLLKNIILDKERKNLWVTGSRKVANDSEKYIIKIKLGEIWVKEEENIGL